MLLHDRKGVDAWDKPGHEELTAQNGASPRLVASRGHSANLRRNEKLP
ncbi:MAG TPA: hypothetical protein VGG01_24245 [Xanthobacteraceae bacterium]